MPEQEGILFRLSLFQRVFAGCRQSLLGDGEMSCHDSRAPSLRPVRHYPHLLDIDPKPRIEWDFNPPETCPLIPKIAYRVYGFNFAWFEKRLRRVRGLGISAITQPA